MVPGCGKSYYVLMLAVWLFGGQLDTISLDNLSQHPTLCNVEVLAQSPRQRDSVAASSPDQVFFLKRLERLARLSRYGAKHQMFTREENRLLRWSAFSTYQDCVSLGIAENALTVIAEQKDCTPA